MKKEKLSVGTALTAAANLIAKRPSKKKAKEEAELQSVSQPNKKLKQDDSVLITNGFIQDANMKMPEFEVTTNAPLLNSLRDETMKDDTIVGASQPALPVSKTEMLNNFIKRGRKLNRANLAAMGSSVEEARELGFKVVLPRFVRGNHFYNGLKYKRRNGKWRVAA